MIVFLSDSYYQVSSGETHLLFIRDLVNNPECGLLGGRAEEAAVRSWKHVKNIHCDLSRTSPGTIVYMSTQFV